MRVLVITSVVLSSLAVGLLQPAPADAGGLNIVGRFLPGPWVLPDPDPAPCPEGYLVGRIFGQPPLCFDPDDPEPIVREVPGDAVPSLQAQGFVVQVLSGPGGGGGPAY